jgi:large subunit ribosomal protein L30
MSDKVKVTLVRSVNGTSVKQRATVKALGLHKINSSHVLPNRVEVQGMIGVVQHLVKVEEA